MPEFAPFIIVIFVVIFVLVAVLGYYFRQKRRKEMLAFAQANGLAFDPSQDGSLESRFPAFDCLSQGSNRYAYNLLRGNWNGRGLLGFDYHYETYSTDSKGRRTTHHHHFSAVILASDVPLEPLLIRPEGFFDKVKEFFGFDDIDFESAEFSRAFFVKASNRKWAYDVIHARTMEFLLGSPRFSIRFHGSDAIAFRGRRFAVSEFASAAGVVEGILDALPEYVVRQQRGQG